MDSRSFVEQHKYWDENTLLSDQTVNNVEVDEWSNPKWPLQYRQTEDNLSTTPITQYYHPKSVWQGVVRSPNDDSKYSYPFKVLRIGDDLYYIYRKQIKRVVDIFKYIDKGQSIPFHSLSVNLVEFDFDQNNTGEIQDQFIDEKTGHLIVVLGIPYEKTFSNSEKTIRFYKITGIGIITGFHPFTEGTQFSPQRYNESFFEVLLHNIYGNQQNYLQQLDQTLYDQDISIQQYDKQIVLLGTDKGFVQVNVDLQNQTQMWDWYLSENSTLTSTTEWTQQVGSQTNVTTYNILKYYDGTTSGSSWNVDNVVVQRTQEYDPFVQIQQVGDIDNFYNDNTEYQFRGSVNIIAMDQHTLQKQIYTGQENVPLQYTNNFQLDQSYVNENQYFIQTQQNIYAVNVKDIESQISMTPVIEEIQYDWQLLKVQIIPPFDRVEVYLSTDGGQTWERTQNVEVYPESYVEFDSIHKTILIKLTELDPNVQYMQKVKIGTPQYSIETNQIGFKTLQQDQIPIEIEQVSFITGEGTKIDQKLNIPEFVTADPDYVEFMQRSQDQEIPIYTFKVEELYKQLPFDIVNDFEQNPVFSISNVQDQNLNQSDIFLVKDQNDKVYTFKVVSQNQNQDETFNYDIQLTMTSDQSFVEVQNEDIGTGDGSTTVFTVQNKPVKSIEVYKDGVLVSETDYSFDEINGIITFNTQPESGQTLTQNYTYQDIPNKNVNLTTADSVMLNPHISITTPILKENTYYTIEQKCYLQSSVNKQSVEFETPEVTGMVYDVEFSHQDQHYKEMILDLTDQNFVNNYVKFDTEKVEFVPGLGIRQKDLLDEKILLNEEDFRVLNETQLSERYITENIVLTQDGIKQEYPFMHYSVNPTQLNITQGNVSVLPKQQYVNYFPNQQDRSYYVNEGGQIVISDEKQILTSSQTYEWVKVMPQTVQEFESELIQQTDQPQDFRQIYFTIFGDVMYTLYNDSSFTKYYKGELSDIIRFLNDPQYTKLIDKQSNPGGTYPFFIHTIEYFDGASQSPQVFESTNDFQGLNSTFQSGVPLQYQNQYVKFYLHSYIYDETNDSIQINQQPFKEFEWYTYNSTNQKGIYQHLIEGDLVIEFELQDGRTLSVVDYPDVFDIQLPSYEKLRIIQRKVLPVKSITVKRVSQDPLSYIGDILQWDGSVKKTGPKIYIFKETFIPEITLLLYDQNSQNIQTKEFDYVTETKWENGKFKATTEDTLPQFYSFKIRVRQTRYSIFENQQEDSYDQMLQFENIQLLQQNPDQGIIITQEQSPLSITNQEYIYNFYHLNQLQYNMTQDNQKFQISYDDGQTWFTFDENTSSWVQVPDQTYTSYDDIYDLKRKIYQNGGSLQQFLQDTSGSKPYIPQGLSIQEQLNQLEPYKHDPLSSFYNGTKSKFMMQIVLQGDQNRSDDEQVQIGYMGYVVYDKSLYTPDVEIIIGESNNDPNVDGIKPLLHDVRKIYRQLIQVDRPTGTTMRQYMNYKDKQQDGSFDWYDTWIDLNDISTTPDTLFKQVDDIRNVEIKQEYDEFENFRYKMKIELQNQHPNNKIVVKQIRLDYIDMMSKLTLVYPPKDLPLQQKTQTFIYRISRDMQMGTQQVQFEINFSYLDPTKPDSIVKVQTFDTQQLTQDDPFRDYEFFDPNGEVPLGDTGQSMEIQIQRKEDYKEGQEQPKLSYGFSQIVFDKKFVHYYGQLSYNRGIPLDDEHYLVVKIKNIPDDVDRIDLTVYLWDGSKG